VIHVLAGAAFFAAASYLGILIANSLRLERYADGPPAGEPRAQIVIAVAAVIGGLFASNVPSGQQLLLAAVVCSALSGIWCTDVQYGVVPDVLTLVPLALVLSVAFFRHEWLVFVSAAVPAGAFALAALLSKGRGMGWGDVKLAALGGAVLGLEMSLLAFSGACFIAALYAYARGRRDVPIALAPYLIAAIALAIPGATFV
jgi:prepilin signal peptidase PulO-like enzyme (type II secretory pathway)